MSEESRNDRFIWSCRFGRLPQEEEITALEEALHDPETSFWDDAASLRRYLDLTGLSQSACARALGRSQASVANRLRLLRLPESVRERMRAAALTERHARAILRLSGEGAQLSAVESVIRQGMNVAETESYVERHLPTPESGEGAPLPFRALLTELRTLRRDCPEASFTLEESAQWAVLTIRLPKKTVSEQK